MFAHQLGSSGQFLPRRFFLFLLIQALFRTVHFIRPDNLPAHCSSRKSIRCDIRSTRQQEHCYVSACSGVRFTNWTISCQRSRATFGVHQPSRCVSARWSASGLCPSSIECFWHHYRLFPTLLGRKASICTVRGIPKWPIMVQDYQHHHTGLSRGV